MVRGIERRDIFRSDDDLEDFLARLAVVGPATGTAVYAWSLLPNHAHLLLRSGALGLSAFMRRLQTGYAAAFNRCHRRAGHLFQNRFKSVLVEEEPYFLELVRYLHLIPLLARLVKTLRGLNAYPWCGHAAIMGNREAVWQDVGEVLGRFGSEEGRARRAYRKFVADGVRQGRRHELSGGGLIRSIGGRKPELNVHPWSGELMYRRQVRTAFVEAAQRGCLGMGARTFLRAKCRMTPAAKKIEE